MNEKQAAALCAAGLVRDGMTVGLGTGTTAAFFIEALGERVRGGLRVQGVCTSRRACRLAAQFGVPVVSPDDVGHIDLDVDGVDEIDPQFCAVKGGGGALLREKIIAHRAREVIWIMDAGKRRAALGAFPLPVEVLPFAAGGLQKELAAFGSPVLRRRGKSPFHSRRFMVVYIRICIFVRADPCGAVLGPPGGRQP